MGTVRLTCHVFQFLTGRVKKTSDMPQSAFFKALPRFQGENFEHNLRLLSQVEALADKKGCTPSQLALSWVRSLNRRPDMPVIIPIPGTGRSERVAENATHIELSDDEMAEIDATLADFQWAGARYPDWVPVDT